ncbi:MAG: DUF1572 family protein [Acidobacteriota bacterium]|nr:DUF1572 family protein [Acidobacteriota bacterium]
MDVAAEFLSYSDRKLGQLVQTVTQCLQRLDDQQMWQRGGPHENTIGNLILHLCGNMRQWIMHGVGGAPDVRTRDAEFEAEGILNRDGLVQLFAQTVSEARSVIATLPHEQLMQLTDPQKNGAVTVLEAIAKVVGHVQEHTGQIILLTKQMTGRDLDLTIPRRR